MLELNDFFTRIYPFPLFISHAVEMVKTGRCFEAAELSQAHE
jgi:hypothetical protein